MGGKGGGGGWGVLRGRLKQNGRAMAVRSSGRPLFQNERRCCSSFSRVRLSGRGTVVPASSSRLPPDPGSRNAECTTASVKALLDDSTAMCGPAGASTLTALGGSREAGRDSRWIVRAKARHVRLRGSVSWAVLCLIFGCWSGGDDGQGVVVGASSLRQVATASAARIGRGCERDADGGGGVHVTLLLPQRALYGRGPCPPGLITDNHHDENYEQRRSPGPGTCTYGQQSWLLVV